MQPPRVTGVPPKVVQRRSRNRFQNLKLCRSCRHSLCSGHDPRWRSTKATFSRTPGHQAYARPLSNSQAQLSHQGRPSFYPPPKPHYAPSQSYQYPARTQGANSRRAAPVHDLLTRQYSPTVLPHFFPLLQRTSYPLPHSCSAPRTQNASPNTLQTSLRTTRVNSQHPV